jgi:hypothetical protein
VQLRPRSSWRTTLLRRQPKMSSVAAVPRRACGLPGQRPRPLAVGRPAVPSRRPGRRRYGRGAAAFDPMGDRRRRPRMYRAAEKPGASAPPPGPRRSLIRGPLGHRTDRDEGRAKRSLVLSCSADRAPCSTDLIPCSPA